MSVTIPEILLIEDDDDHAEIVTRGLESSTFPSRIHRVADGEAGLDYVFRRGIYADPALSPRPHMILLDLRLPIVNGIEVLRAIKAAPEVSAIPVIMLTTSDAEKDMLSAYQGRANSYLVKSMEFLHVKQMTEALSAYWLAWNRIPGEKNGRPGGSH
jgi:CheY-like chemotaxis protein